jgi:hypothetical protein
MDPRPGYDHPDWEVRATSASYRARALSPIGLGDNLPVPRMLAKAGFAKKDAVGAIGRFLGETLGKVRDSAHSPSPAGCQERQIACGIVWGSGGLLYFAWF